MRVFGCTWKINFQEIIFSWSSVLKASTRKWFEVKIFTSNHFWTHAQRERESLRLRRSTNPLVYELITPSTSSTLPITSSTSPIYEPTNQSSTQSLRPMNLQLRRWPRTFTPRTDLRPFAFDPKPWIDLSLCVIFDFLCDFVRPTSLWSLIFFVVVMVVWVVVFWWFSCCVGGGGK